MLWLANVVPQGDFILMKRCRNTTLMFKWALHLAPLKLNESGNELVVDNLIDSPKMQIVLTNRPHSLKKNDFYQVHLKIKLKWMRHCLNSSILNSFSYFKLASLFDMRSIVVLDWSNANFFKFMAKRSIFLNRLSALSL